MQLKSVQPLKIIIEELYGWLVPLIGDQQGMLVDHKVAIVPLGADGLGDNGDGLRLDPATETNQGQYGYQS